MSIATSAAVMVGRPGLHPTLLPLLLHRLILLCQPNFRANFGDPESFGLFEGLGSEDIETGAADAMEMAGADSIEAEPLSHG